MKTAILLAMALVAFSSNPLFPRKEARALRIEATPATRVSPQGAGAGAQDSSMRTSAGSALKGLAFVTVRKDRPRPLRARFTSEK
jgi:hypothetical protein